MKKYILSTIACSLLSINLVGAELQVLSQEELETNSQTLSAQKIYFNYNSEYTPNTDDLATIKILKARLELYRSQERVNLRKLYKKIDTTLTELSKRTRGNNGEILTQIDTRLYYLLEQANNIIADFDGNQDLGCKKGLAHMEGTICTSNTRNIVDETGTGYQKYDFITEKWGEIKMMNCNDGYSKSELISGATMCISD